MDLVTALIVLASALIGAAIPVATVVIRKHFDVS